jgi:hypothetical protein
MGAGPAALLSFSVSLNSRSLLSVFGAAPLLSGGEFKKLADGVSSATGDVGEASAAAAPVASCAASRRFVSLVDARRGAMVEARCGTALLYPTRRH